MKLYKRLGIDTSDIEIIRDVKFFNQTLELLKSSDDVPGLIQDSLYECNWIIYEYYLTDNHVKAKKYIYKLIETTKERFWGNWQKKYPVSRSKPADPIIWKTVNTWTTEFQHVTLWASCINDWKNVYKFAEYPADDCPIGRYEPRQEGIWYLFLAAVLRGENQEKLDEYIGMIQRGKRNKYQKLLLSMLLAVLEIDTNHFNIALNEHLQYCKKHLFVKRHPRDKVSIDGTFLINYATHIGLAVEFASEFNDRIIKVK